MDSISSTKPVFLRTVQNQNKYECLHAFPGIFSKIIPKKLNIADPILIYSSFGAVERYINGFSLMVELSGDRCLYSVVPTFYHEGYLDSGTPILFENSMISVVTIQCSENNYPVSGLGDISGHFLSHNVSVKVAKSDQSVYGNLVDSYDQIKFEALRKKDKSLPMDVVKYEIISFGKRIDIVGWVGDNIEIFHSRYNGPIHTVSNRYTSGEFRLRDLSSSHRS